MSATIELTTELIRRQSITPADEGCLDLIGARLAAIGFKLERLRFEQVDNLWARRGSDGPVFCFAGHTDVVPSGPLDQWQSDPFQPEIRNGLLYGRGAADMKGSLAAMVTACEAFIAEHPNHNGSIAFLLTSDEEGIAEHGTVRVVETLQARDEQIDWCLVGEPSSSEKVGDVVKNGRRGSLIGKLTIKGIQGHVAYPQLADNPVHRAMPALTEMVNTVWDEGNEFYPPTSFQISNANAGTGAENVIPGSLDVLFGFRFCTESSVESLQQRTTEILDRHGLDYKLAWRVSGLPFLTSGGPLLEATVNAIRDVTGYETELSTAGGTSDGRFIAPTGTHVIELGPLNATIHKANECVSCEDLDTLSSIYQQILRNLLV